LSMIDPLFFSLFFSKLYVKVYEPELSDHRFSALSGRPSKNIANCIKLFDKGKKDGLL
jgi:hypothetical protein